MANGLQRLKKRISGFRTAFNVKIRSADALVRLVQGPPLLKTPTVVSQLKERLTELRDALNH